MVSGSGLGTDDDDDAPMMTVVILRRRWMTVDDDDLNLSSVVGRGARWPSPHLCPSSDRQMFWAPASYTSSNGFLSSLLGRFSMRLLARDDNFRVAYPC